MNRTQAEHLLDSYERVISAEKGAGKIHIAGLKDSVREVILDAMCETRYYPLTTSPNTYPYKPLVTWTGEDSLGAKRTWEVNE